MLGNTIKQSLLCVVFHKLVILSNTQSFSSTFAFLFYFDSHERTKVHVFWVLFQWATYICVFGISQNIVPSNYNFMRLLYSLSLTSWFWKKIFMTFVCFSYVCLGNRAAGSSLLPAQPMLPTSSSLLLPTAVQTGHSAWPQLIAGIFCLWTTLFYIECSSFHTGKTS